MIESTPNIFHQNSLILLSLSSTAVLYLPAELYSSIDGIVFMALGWMLSIVTTFFEYYTIPIRTKKSKTELYTKIMLYTLVFLLLKFTHLWLIYDKYEYLSAVANFIVIAVYVLIVLSELKLAGGNIKIRYGKKPKLFEYLEDAEKWMLKHIVKRAEKTCNLEDTTEKES